MKICNLRTKKFYNIGPWNLSHLLAAVWGKIENKHSEERDAHAGDDEVDGVEQSLSAHGDVKRDIKVRLITASVELDVPNGWHCLRSIL